MIPNFLITTLFYNIIRTLNKQFKLFLFTLFNTSMTNYLTFSTIWCIKYFFLFFYLLLFVLVIFLNYTTFSNNTLFNYITGFDIFWLLASPILLMLIINFSWTSPTILVWFGHIIFSPFQFKMTYVIIIVFSFVWLTYSSSFYFSSQEVFDYTNVTYSFFVWVIFLFNSNNIFTVIFFIEILFSIYVYREQRINSG